MARISIDDLSEDEEISQEEMDKVMGGYSTLNTGGTSLNSPQLSPDAFPGDTFGTAPGGRFGSGDTFCG